MGHEAPRGAPCPIEGASCPRPGVRRPIWKIYLINDYKKLVLSNVSNVLVIRSITTRQSYDSTRTSKC